MNDEKAEDAIDMVVTEDTPVKAVGGWCWVTKALVLNKSLFTRHPLTVFHRMACPTIRATTFVTRDTQGWGASDESREEEQENKK